MLAVMCVTGKQWWDGQSAPPSDKTSANRQRHICPSATDVTHTAASAGHCHASDDNQYM